MLAALLPGLLILVTVGLNTLAQALLKLGSGQSPLNLYLFSGVLVYGFSTIFYILVLSRFDLSTAYPIIIGLTVLATTMTGAFLLGEKVAMTHWLGIGLMLSGISTIALGKPMQ
ncbi:MAG: small multidrug resistance protein [Leptolyngbya foveolarum]|uniref:Small multidrug resistance protein n=1 Tax=Leptolyngbya foveolarum TaxID=47253 RepID=A0A2W4UJQ0_9CYAN|nr:MAG: small multidrug resistance protein [Leptolyngbya foveolarum]